MCRRLEELQGKLSEKNIKWGSGKKSTPFDRWEDTYIQLKDSYKAKTDHACSLVLTVQATRKKKR